MVLACDSPLALEGAANKDARNVGLTGNVGAVCL
jgi:hypothetical protein